MFSAILLLCSQVDGTNTYCTTVSSPYISFSIEQCLDDLAHGYAEAESMGWNVVSYTCYNWDNGEDIEDMMSSPT